MTARYRRVEAVDVLLLDEGTICLFDTRLVALSPLGAAAYDLLVDAMNAEELTTELVAIFGEPGEGSPFAVVEGLLAGMEAEGVLTRADG